MACAGVALAGTGTPSSRRIWSIGFRETKTDWPASGLTPVKLDESRTRSGARLLAGEPDMPAPVSDASRAAAGAAPASLPRPLRSGVLGDTDARSGSAGGAEAAADSVYEAGSVGIGPLDASMILRFALA